MWSKLQTLLCHLKKTLAKRINNLPTQNVPQSTRTQITASVFSTCQIFIINRWWSQTNLRETRLRSHQEPGMHLATTVRQRLMGKAKLKTQRQHPMEIIMLWHLSMKWRQLSLKNAMSKMRISDLFNKLREVMKLQSRKLWQRLRSKALTVSTITWACTYLSCNMVSRVTQSIWDYWRTTCLYYIQMESFWVAKVTRTRPKAISWKWVCD